MISEILILLFLIIIACKYLNIFCNVKRKQDVLVEGTIRELGALERWLHRRFTTNQYLYSNNVIAHSKIPMYDEKVEESLQILAKRHPLLQAAITEVECSDGIHYYFTKMPAFKIEYHQSEKLATDPNHWQDVMSKDLLEPINDRDGPLWRCRRLKECVDSCSGRITNCFVFAFHHSIFDGTSWMLLCDEFLGILDNLHKQIEVKDISYDIRPSVETLLGENIRPEWWRRAKIKLMSIAFRMGLISFKSKKIDVYFNKYPVVSSIDPTVKPENRFIFTNLSKEETDHLIHICKQHGCTVHGAIIAAANMAMAEILQNGQVKKPKTIPSVYQIDTRRDIKSLQIRTDYLGFCAVSGKLDYCVPVYDSKLFKIVCWKMAKDISDLVHKTVDSQKHLQSVKDLQCLTITNMDTLNLSRVFNHHAKRFGAQLFSVSNIGRFQAVSGRQFYIENMFYAYAGHKEGNLFDIFAVTINGTFCCSLVYFPHVTAQIQAEEFNSKFLQNLSCARDDKR